MAFMVHLTDDGRVPSLEYLPAGAITPKVGMALTQSSGKLALATGVNAPKYISMIETASSVADGTEIPVFRVLPDMIFETTLSTTGTTLKSGDKVTIHTDALQVTATTTSGVAEIIEIVGTGATGDAARVRF